MDLAIEKLKDEIETHELLELDQSPTPRKFFGRFRAWRATLLAGTCLSAVVLLFNLSLLIWAGRNAVEHQGDILTIYRGECHRMKSILTWSHLGINVLSTLLLSASTACMQCVSAPTRDEVDRAHQQGSWLHIGVLGLRNFRHVSKWRRVVWVLLAISSIPIHLLYNSILFSTEMSNDYQVILTAANLFTSDQWNEAWWNDTYQQTWPVDNFSSFLSSLTRLELADCIREYSAVHVSQWRNVLVATDILNPSTLDFVSAGDWTDSVQTFICQDDSYWGGCELYSNINTNAGVLSWQVSEPAWNDTLKAPYEYEANVQYCLAQKSTPVCKISLSISIYVFVIACNLVKLSCLLVTLGAETFRPLITIGDAVASFLNEPDPFTIACGPISAAQVYNSTFKDDRNVPILKPWQPKRCFWFAAATWQRWVSVGVWSSGVWTTCVCLLQSCAGYVFGFGVTAAWQIWQNDMAGQTSRNDLIPLSEGWSTGGSILFANMPQLLISFIYVLYNGLYTSMLLTDEISGYGSTRKALRVSEPTGSQRSSYWLQLPYKYALPLMTAMSLLHWLISQSIFLVRVDIYDTLGQEDPDRSIYGCGWSPFALLLAVILGGILILVLFANGFRRFPDTMPILSSCSFAISAACHRGVLEEDDIALRPLQYGVLSTTDNFTLRVGFSAEEVRPCVEGWVYR